MLWWRRPRASIIKKVLVEAEFLAGPEEVSPYRHDPQSDVKCFVILAQDCFSV